MAKKGGKAIEVEGVIRILPLVEGSATVTGLSLVVGGGLGVALGEQWLSLLHKLTEPNAQWS